MFGKSESSNSFVSRDEREYKEPAAVNTKVQVRSVGYVGGFVGGYLWAWLIPTPFNLIIAIPLLFLYFKRMPQTVRIAVLLGVAVRIVFVSLALLLFFSSPRLIPLWSYSARPIQSVLVLGSDIGLFEGMVRHYAESVKKGQSKKDPFSGEALRNVNGVSYSVGPDGRDDLLTVAYDPSNGIMSSGDVVAGR